MPSVALRWTRDFRGPLLALLFVATVCLGCRSTPDDSEILASIRDTTLIPMLGSYNEAEQNQAIQSFLNNLEKYPDEIAKILVTSISDPVYSDRTKLVAACLLALLRDDRGIEILLTNLGADSEGTQDLVRRHLRSYGPRIIPVVAEILNTGNTRARLNAAIVLDDLAQENRVKECYESMWNRLEHEPEAQVRFVLIAGLAKDERTIAQRRLLLSLTREPDDLNREIAWGALKERLPIPADIIFEPAASVETRKTQVARLTHWIENQSQRF